MSIKSKSIRKRIKTTLTVKLMEGKTRRDMYRDFFRGKPFDLLDKKVVKTEINLAGEPVSYRLYKMFSGHGASREFLELFEFVNKEVYASVDDHMLCSAMYDIIPFNKLSGIDSYIVSFSTNAYNLDINSDIQLEIETRSWSENVTADQVKATNKENARKLRHYLVSLPSVQGVPYSCTFREDEIAETECSV